MANRVTCPLCGSMCRVLHVDENAPEGVQVTYTCPNSRCSGCGNEVAQRTLPTAAGQDGQQA